MKKTLCTLLMIGISCGTVVFGEGCFHDPIQVVDKPGVIIQGARIRNLACMNGSIVITTLKAGTKVRIIGQTAWTKVVIPGGKIGRIGNGLLKESDNRENLPDTPIEHKTDSYCDTTDTKRCPYPCGANENPTFYTETTQTTASNPVLDELLEEFYTSLEQKYGDDIEQQTTTMQKVIKALTILKNKNNKLKTAVDYIITNLQQKLNEQG